MMFLEIAVAEVIDGCSCASGIARPWKRKEGWGWGRVCGREADIAFIQI